MIKISKIKDNDICKRLSEAMCVEYADSLLFYADDELQNAVACAVNDGIAAVAAGLMNDSAIADGVVRAALFALMQDGVTSVSLGVVPRKMLRTELDLSGEIDLRNFFRTGCG